MTLKQLSTLVAAAAIATLSSSCARSIRSAEDITPGNPTCEKLDWRYGAGDIRIQTTKITKQLMDRWAAKADPAYGKPRIVITAVENRTDRYISTDMIRDIIEGVAVNDGRCTIVVGDCHDEKELDKMMVKIQNDPKYSNSSKLEKGQATAPQFLGKLRLSKATTQSTRYDYEDYRMTVTLYDIETQEVVDSAWDVLRKKVQA